MAAAAATAGLLGALGFAAGAAPWGRIAAGLTGERASAGAFLFDTMGGGQPGHGGGQAEVMGSAPASGTVPGVADIAVGRHAASAPVSAAQSAGRKAYAAKHAKATATTHLIYDSINPDTIPAGEAVAAYATGTYMTPAAQVSGRSSVLWIDTRATDPAASVLDVEPGDASPAQAAQWVQERLSASLDAVAILYTSKSEWADVREAVAGLPAGLRARIRYWIADPTGSPHVLAGASATQWYWGHDYDITTATAGFPG